MFRYLFKRDTILATLMVFLLMGLLSLIPLNTHVLDPIKMALQDFDYNDMAYSKFGKNNHVGVDTNIVIVNIEDAGRSEITLVLDEVVAMHPKVIGVDVMFNEPKDPSVDFALLDLFKTNSNVVLAYNLAVEHKALKAEGFLYPQVQQKGYANFVGEEGGTIRYFTPVMKNENGSFESFTSAVMRIANPARQQSFAKRFPGTTQINYSRTENKYLVLNGKDLFRGGFDSTLLAGKIVLLGYVNPAATDIEDKHFTPFNKKSVGKSVPDMPGVIIHANILSMINSGDYITKWPAWLVWTLAVLLCWLHMAVFIRYFIDKHIWFHLVAKTVQLVSAILIVYLGLLFFYKWDIKINLTPGFVAIILAVDVLYFYEAMIAWLHKKIGFHSLFVHHAH